MRLTQTCSLALYAILALGCGVVSSVDLDFPAPPSRSNMPPEWQPDILLEQRYPVLPPRGEAERNDAGRAFLLHDVRIDGNTLLLLNRQTFVQTDARGRFSAQDYQLRRDGDHQYFELTYELERPDFRQTLTMQLDPRMRLLSYVARRAFLLSDDQGQTIERTSYIRSTWDWDAKLYKTTDSDGFERTIVTDQPEVPVEVLPLLALLAPAQPIQAEFSTISIVLGGIFQASLEVRPAYDVDDSSSFVTIRSLSPLGEDYHLIIGGERRKYIAGRVGERMRIYPAQQSDFEKVKELGALIRRERNRMLYNTLEVFSHYSSQGTTPAIPESGHAPAASWLMLSFGETMDLAIGNAVPETPSQIISFVDRASLDEFQSKARTPSSGETQPTESSTAEVTIDLGASQQSVTIGLELLPPGQTLESYADMVKAMMIQDASVSGLRETKVSTSSGPAIRIDMSLSARGVSPSRGEPVIYLSLLLMEREGVVLRAEFSGIGDVSEWWSGLDAVYSSTRLSRPPLKIQE